jgi:hypothetical protein
LLEVYRLATRLDKFDKNRQTSLSSKFHNLQMETIILQFTVYISMTLEVTKTL